MVTRLDFAVQSTAEFAQLRNRFVTLPAKAKLMLSRESGIDISSPGRQSHTLLVGEETAGALYAGDVFFSPGFGAPPHHQPTEDELWYVLEGDLDVRVGLRRATLAPGAFAFIPRDTTHAFRNNGTSLVRLLSWNAPAGHERAFEAMRAKAAQGITDFPSLKSTLSHHGIEMHADDTELASNDRPGGSVAPKIVSQRTGGRDASRPDADVRVLLENAESAGRYEVIDVLLDAGAAPLQLGRTDAHTCFYIVRGTADVTLDDDQRRIEQGAFAYLPVGAHASIAVAEGTSLQLVCWTTTGA